MPGLVRQLLCVLLLAPLLACATAEDFRRADQASCTSYGFTPGTEAFAACLQRENLARQYRTALPPPGFYGWYGGFAAGWPVGMW